MRRSILALPLLGAIACGGGEDRETPPPPPTATVVYDIDSDPCTARYPTPNDMFRGDDVADERGCSLPSDPLDAAIEAVVRDDGAPLDSTVSVPVEGDLNEDSLTSTATFALVGTATDASDGLPPVILMSSPIPTTTATDDWELVEHSVRAVEGGLEIVPAEPLSKARYYVAVVTDAIKNSAGGDLQPSDVTKQLVSEEVSGNTQIERERGRLATPLDVLGRASPPVDRGRIASIHGFTTKLGLMRLGLAVAEWRALVEDGTLPLSIGGSPNIIPPSEVYRAGTPPEFYDKVQGFVRGTITVPTTLDDNGYLALGGTREIEFIASVPEVTGSQSAIALVLPGYHRAAVDVRNLAQELSGGPAAVVLGFDLAGHGHRTVDASGAPDLEDVDPNGNPELSDGTPDGIPDRSGERAFSGDARALRDGMIASTIEVLHVLRTLNDPGVFAGWPFIPRQTEINIIAEGHSSLVAIYVAAFAEGLNTLILPSGGGDLAALIQGGPGPLRAHFESTAPEGVDVDAYLDRLSASVLEGISLDEAGALVNGRYVDRFDWPRVLLPHPSESTYVDEAARGRLVEALGLPSSRVSAHRPSCDDFFLYTCTLGDDPSWLGEAKLQIASFISSNGQRVTTPP